MQPASISFAICGLRRIIIVFSLFQTNKMEMEMEGGYSFIISSEHFTVAIINGKELHHLSSLLCFVLAFIQWSLTLSHFR